MAPAPAAPRPGAQLLADGRCAFTVWASRAAAAAVHLLGDRDRVVPLTPAGRGYFTAVVDDVHEGDVYVYRLDDNPAHEWPDPASRLQPQGVHGPSAVVTTDFDWTDDSWSGRALRDYIIYELHVGTFTHAGSFDAVISHLAELRELGITALELMPVAEFPGRRNWGYDGVYPYAAHSGYGGPQGLKRLVNACHRAGLAVVLDVVYNHLGPEGNYLHAFAHYFTERYRTPWGAALNFDGPHSDEVRAYFIGNALQWIEEFHVDALRLDAVHAIFDMSAHPFLRELAARAHECARRLGRPAYLIAESDLGDPRMIRPPVAGGFGMDAQWLDDFHHSLHTLLTSERRGYYADFGDAALLARSFRDGFAYTGQYSEYRKRRHGAPAPEARPEQFVVCAQNHDQIGNRLAGDRLATHLGLERLKLAAAAVLLAPFTPLLFMGEEYGEVAPFPYFVSHTDPVLIEAVRDGRRHEFAAFGWAAEPPDAQSAETFFSARLNRALRAQEPHRTLLDFHRQLLRLRCAHSVLVEYDRLDAHASGSSVVITRMRGDTAVLLALNFAGEGVPLADPGGAAGWRILLDSAAEEWGGPGHSSSKHAVTSRTAAWTLAPHSAMLLLREN